MKHTAQISVAVAGIRAGQGDPGVEPAGSGAEQPLACPRIVTSPSRLQLLAGDSRRAEGPQSSDDFRRDLS
jgi:hypothetical protein